MLLNKTIGKIILKNPSLNLKLKKAYSKKTPRQYIEQTIQLSFFFTIAITILYFSIVIKIDKSLLLYIPLIIIGFFYLSYTFFFSYIDVSISKVARSQDNDLLFILEFFLINLTSGNPMGIAIEHLSKLNKKTSKFFKRINLQLKTGEDIQLALKNSIDYCASNELKTFLKKLSDSMEVGINLEKTITLLIKDSITKKNIRIKNYSKKINPLITMYLIIGIVLPSLGITFFIIGATIMQITPYFLGVILVIIFLILFVFQYLFYTMFKFGRETL
jgi:hypothetical protein